VTTDTSTEVAIREFEASSEFQCYPNPFTHQTSIAFHVEDPGKVILRICDLAGKIIRVLLEDQLETGEYDIIWEGRDDQGTSVTSGLYILDAIIGDQRTFKKILKLCP
jgi:flagellar hook assembly protein FlgD